MAIRQWKPWDKSTGPKTDEGKQKASRNADKRGGWEKTRKELRQLNKELAKQAALIRNFFD